MPSRVMAHLSAIAYNTSLVKQEDAPRSYADLLDPKWQGRIVKGHPGYSAAIMTATFVLARELDLEVTVEGVETYEQYAFLRDEGKCELQGFLFSQPKPATAWVDPASLVFAAPQPRKAEPAAAAPAAAAIPLAARQARRAS